MVATTPEELFSGEDGSITNIMILLLLIISSHSFGYCLFRRSIIIDYSEQSRTIFWVFGIIVVILANVLYAIVLSDAPVWVLGVSFSMTLVAVSGFIPCESLSTTAIPYYFAGYSILILGAIIFCIIIPEAAATTTTAVPVLIYHFNNNKDDGPIQTIMIFWKMLLVLIAGGIFFAVWHGILYPFSPDSNSEFKTKRMILPISSRNDSSTSFMVRFLYQSTLGTIKAALIILLKLLQLVVLSETRIVALFIGTGLVLLIGMVLFSFLVYSRYTIIEAFPIEFSTLTLLVILGGTVANATNATTAGLLLLWVNTQVIVTGMAIIAFAGAASNNNKNDTTASTSRSTSGSTSRSTSGSTFRSTSTKHLSTQ